MKLLPLLALVLLIASCSSRPTFRIEGAVLPGIREGQTIYLVPEQNANRSNVDSTIVKNGRFHFEGDTERVSIIRLPINNRLDAQELLVVTEPGVINATIGKTSSVGGTPQNRIMAQWQDAIIKRNLVASHFMNERRKGFPGRDSIRLKTILDSTQQASTELTKQIISKNRGTTIANFLNRLTGL